MTGAIVTMFQLIKKLYNHLNGCPLVYIIYSSFLFNRVFSTYPGLSMYLLYAYIYKVIRNNYLCTRERNKRNQTKLKDMQLQAEIVHTKLCVFESELNDSVKALQREVEQLRSVRARVAEMIINDDTLRHLLRVVNEYNADSISVPTTDRQALDQLTDNDLMFGLLERVILNNDEEPETNRKKCETELTPKQTEYSVNDVDSLQDCRVKIVKVTNVYKVAYLKNYIKQKKLRRANKRALLKKKMESIKELFDEWHEKLNMVLSSNMTKRNIDRNSIDMASQEAMGDRSKPFDISDSDSDIRINDSMFFDEFRPNRNEYQESGMCGEYYCGEYGADPAEVYHPQYMPQCKMFLPHEVLPITEETCSQLAIDEITDTADGEYRDNVDL